VLGQNPTWESLGRADLISILVPGTRGRAGRRTGSVRTKPNNHRLLPMGSGLLVTSPCKRPTQILDKLCDVAFHAVRLRDRVLAFVTARIYVTAYLSHCLANRAVPLNVSRSRRSNVRRCFWDLWTGGRAPSSPVGEMKLFFVTAPIRPLHGKGANARIASLQDCIVRSLTAPPPRTSVP